MHPLVHNRFERIQGVIGLIHRPLNISVLNRYVAPVASPCPQPIDRYKLRHEFLGQTPLWLEFDAAAQSLIAQYISNLVHSHSGSTMVLSRILEFKLRQFALVISISSLGIHYIGNVDGSQDDAKIYHSHLPGLFSLLDFFDQISSAAYTNSSIQQNRRHRFETFINDSVDLSLRNQILDWDQCIRSLCPKQLRQRIQMHDQHGAPQTPQEELNRIVAYYGTLYEDLAYSPQQPPALVTLPLIEAQFWDQLRRLPITKALAPDGMPTILWKQFASELSTFIFHDVCQIYGGGEVDVWM